MMGRTHLAFGLLASLIALMLWPSLPLWLVLLVLLGAVLPDVDHEGSFVNNRFPLTRWIPWLFKHRGFFHSVFPIAAIALLGIWFPSFMMVALALCFGYATHLATDSMTVYGIKPFYPIPIELRGFLRTNGLPEFLLFLAVSCVNVLLVLQVVNAQF